MKTSIFKFTGVLWLGQVAGHVEIRVKRSGLGACKVVTLLLDARADTTAKSQSGKTAEDFELKGRNKMQRDKQSQD